MTAHPATTLRAADGQLEAAFVPSLAMLGSSLTADGAQLLDLRGGVEAYAEHGSTMGIPLLHPWANRLAEPGYRVGDREVAVDTASPLVHTDGNGLAIHGCHPAAAPFAIADHDEAGLVAVFDTAAAPAVLELFPFPHRLTMEVRLDGRALRITTTLEATGRRGRARRVRPSPLPPPARRAARRMADQPARDVAARARPADDPDRPAAAP